MSLDEGQKRFVGYLLSLAKEEHEDRGALADLRSGLGKEPAAMSRVHRHVVPYLPAERFNDRWYYVTATLFGSFARQQRGVSLGKAFGALRQRSDSMDARFVALLNAHAEDVDDHLRHAISLLRTYERPLDWYRLFDDLLRWDDSEGRVQLSWARDFYATSAGWDDAMAGRQSNHSPNQYGGNHD